MKRKLIPFIFILLITTFLISYFFSSKELDVEDFNLSISDNTEIESVEELIDLYHFEWSDEEKDIDIEIKESKKWFTKAVIIENFSRDDSISAEKLVLKITRNDWIWSILEAKWSWKCEKWRGQFFWWWTFCS